jgi:hypothetical protein
MSSKHSTWCWHCLTQATVDEACHVLYVMVVHELTQRCLWIGKGSVSIEQGLVVYADSGRAVADKGHGTQCLATEFLQVVDQAVDIGCMQMGVCPLSSALDLLLTHGSPVETW